MKIKIQRLIAGLLTGVLLICPALAASSFPDVDAKASYAEAVEFLSNAGIMRGDDKGNFNPNKTVTRAEMATIICQMLGEAKNLTTSNNFSDVPVNHWANKYIAKAAELGVVSGYGNGKFGPSDTVTYEQAVTMVVRALGGSDLAQNAGGYPNGFLSVANQYGFLKNVNGKKGAALSRAYVAVIVYNCRGFSFDKGDGTFNDGAQTD